MKKILPLLAASCAVLSTAQAQTVVLNEDFNSLAATASSVSANYGTVQTANTATAQVIDLDDIANASIASAFTLGSGKVLLVSVGDNDFSALRPTVNPVSFSEVSNEDLFSFTFDIYIPTTLDVAIGSINPRLEATGEAGNGSTFTASVLGGVTQTQSAVGEYTMSYTGTVGDYINGAGPADSARPFIFFEQKINGADDGTTAAVAYIDNINFTITTVPEPGTYALFAGALALGAVMIRRRRS